MYNNVISGFSIADSGGLLGFEPDIEMLKKASNLQETIRSFSNTKENKRVKVYKGEVIDDALIQKCLAAEEAYKLKKGVKKVNRRNPLSYFSDQIGIRISIFFLSL